MGCYPCAKVKLIRIPQVGGLGGALNGGGKTPPHITI